MTRLVLIRSKGGFLRHILDLDALPKGLALCGYRPKGRRSGWVRESVKDFTPEPSPDELPHWSRRCPQCLEKLKKKEP